MLEFYFGKGVGTLYVKKTLTQWTLLQDIRKVVQALEQTAREILTVLQSVHQPSGFKESERFTVCTVLTGTGTC